MGRNVHARKSHCAEMLLRGKVTRGNVGAEMSARKCLARKCRATRIPRCQVSSTWVIEGTDQVLNWVQLPSMFRDPVGKISVC